MPRARVKKTAEPANEPKEPYYSGPWWVIEADGIFSKKRVDLGKYSEPEVKKGIVDKRVADLTAQGYQNINVREIAGE